MIEPPPGYRWDWDINNNPIFKKIDEDPLPTAAGAPAGDPGDDDDDDDEPVDPQDRHMVNIFARSLKKAGAFKKPTAPSGGGGGGGAKNYAEKPSIFDGDVSKHETFRDDLLLYTAAIKGDRDKITAALSFLKGGSAHNWRKVWYSQYKDDLINDRLTLDEFLVDFDAKFHDPRKAEKACDDLLRLRCRYKEQFDMFLIRFKDTQVKAGMDGKEHDAQLVKHLKKTLPAVLSGAIRTNYAMEKGSTNRRLKRQLMAGEISQRQYARRSLPGSSGPRHVLSYRRRRR